MRWSRCRGIALNDELTHYFPVQPDEDLHFVCAGQPFLRRSLPFCESKAASFAVPWNRFVMNQFAIANPQCSPLRTGCHLIICKDRAHISNGIVEHCCGFKFSEAVTVTRELKRAEYCTWIWGHNTFEQGFKHGRDERRWCDS